MGSIRKIVLHCSDSSFGSVDIIREWHKQRGWRDIGYNVVITNGVLHSGDDYRAEFDGLVQIGRYYNSDNKLVGDEIGAHTLGLNSVSLGVCLIGETEFTELQISALFKLLKQLILRHNLTPEDIVGHYETPSAKGKTCPNIPMETLRSRFKDYFEETKASHIADGEPTISDITN